ncbi:putative Cytidylate kinase [Trypanosoma vivax]|uniref:Uncharacterized protein n=1 Tax=Trypanosoma vivax (strain Y486) TaxID=1055687 RepID=G0TSM8_TRYVY|nr:putative Cytidylate kinase [Trypanosoma vivax]CCC46955.1 conserved hypothetical protein [Trypanosoma vivax Y486]
MVPLSAALLRQHDDACNGAVIALLSNNDDFKRLAESEGTAIMRRDKEDEEKLREGIEIAKSRGILKSDSSPPPAPLQRIDMASTSTQEAAEKIASMLPGREGNIIVIHGLSGTGKGSTVKKLQGLLPRCVAWSNGNVFRSYTYLILEELQGEVSNELLTSELLQQVERQVKFEEIASGEFDIVLNGKTRVRDIENTLLKTPALNSAVPTVARQMQGEVIRFATVAVEKLRATGYNVILEGRTQTLNYIRTPLRFELVLSDPTLLGQRRAAQRVMAIALESLRDRLDVATVKDAEMAVLDALSKL